MLNLNLCSGGGNWANFTKQVQAPKWSTNFLEFHGPAPFLRNSCLIRSFTVWYTKASTYWNSIAVATSCIVAAVRQSYTTHTTATTTLISIGTHGIDSISFSYLFQQFGSFLMTILPSRAAACLGVEDHPYVPLEVCL